MAVTDLTGTSWIFGEYLVEDYTTGFAYNVDYDVTINYSTTATATCTRLALANTNGTYQFGTINANAIFTKENGDKFSTNVFYNGYNSVPQVNVSVRDGFESLIITFTGGTDVTNADLIAWLEANATLVEEETTPTEITYNGATTSLEAGQTATMSCAEKKAVSDIVIAFGSAGTITYNGTETAVSAGQTATMACNGKKMKTDVVITA